MYQILVVWALSQELNIVRKQIKNANVAWLKIDFLQTWMWNYNAIFALTQKLEKKQYDFVVNIWVSGYIWTKKEDVYQIGHIIDIFSQKELIVPSILNFTSIASCISSNLPVSKVENDLFHFLKKDTKLFSKNILLNDLTLFDMESFGIEFVLEKYNLPRIILKVPIDKIWKETENFDYNLALGKLENSINYFDLLEKIKSYLDKQETQLNLDKYYNKLLFSQRQKEIFNFLYRKYQVLVWDDFDKYFEDYLKHFEWKQLTKQYTSNFLNELEEKLKSTWLLE